MHAARDPDALVATWTYEQAPAGQAADSTPVCVRRVQRVIRVASVSPLFGRHGAAVTFSERDVVAGVEAEIGCEGLQRNWSGSGRAANGTDEAECDLRRDERRNRPASCHVSSADQRAGRRNGEACGAGAAPNRNVTRMPRRPGPEDRQSSPTSSRTTASVPIIDTSFGVATTASARRRVRTTSAPSSPLSINACWIRRPRPAPIDARTAISRCRAVARATSRLAIFAQAMSSTNAARAPTPTDETRENSRGPGGAVRGGSQVDAV